MHRIFGEFNNDITFECYNFSIVVNRIGRNNDVISRHVAMGYTKNKSSIIELLKW